MISKVGTRTGFEEERVPACALIEHGIRTARSNILFGVFQMRGIVFDRGE